MSELKIKTIAEIMNAKLLEAKLPDEGETFKVNDDIEGVDEVDDDSFKTIKKNVTIKKGTTLEVQSASNNVIYVKCSSGKYYGFMTREWKSLPIKLM